jgi:hypothetical protein
MEQHILTGITFQPNLPRLLANMRIKEGSRYVDEFTALLNQAHPLARPKALYRVAPIDYKADDRVVIDGATLKSRVLRVNLEQANRVFLFVATGGLELEAWVQSNDDMLYHFWADAIAEEALRSAIEAVLAHITDRYRPGHLSAMHPGSLADWPIKEQQALFHLLGDPQAAIGVQLLDSMLMSPTKSVSGIYFPTEETFESCQLCPIENCPNRRAPYDVSLYERKYCPAVD